MPGASHVLSQVPRIPIKRVQFGRPAGPGFDRT